MKARCKSCGEIMESVKSKAHPHDFKMCGCGKSFIDDIGLGLVRVSGDIECIKEEQRDESTGTKTGDIS